MRQPSSILVSLLATALVAGCGDSGSTASSTAASTLSVVMDPGDGGDYHPTLDSAHVVDVIDNPYMPLTVGSAWRFEGTANGDTEVTEIVVTADRKTIMGISAFVVRDTVRSDGDIVEDTDDWFTQDTAGNVWYLGEDSKEYENGTVVSNAGSWEAGVDGALPGIVMPATPHVGDVIRQEYSAGEAEDMMRIATVGGQLTVNGTVYRDVVTTTDWSPLEPDVIEEKAYAPGVGNIRETSIAGEVGESDLVEYTPGG